MKTRELAKALELLKDQVTELISSCIQMKTVIVNIHWLLCA